MNSTVRLPRSGGERAVVISGAVWDALCELVEKNDRLTVSPPLYMDRNNRTGRNISVNIGREIRFTARLGAATQDGTNKRWTYAFTEVEKTTAGFDGWANKSGGKTGDAYNRTEEMNGASGLYGNGVDSANLTGTFDIQPAPSGLLVEVIQIGVPGADAEFWFSYENGIDGACP